MARGDGGITPASSRPQEKDWRRKSPKHGRDGGTKTSYVDTEPRSIFCVERSSRSRALTVSQVELVQLSCQQDDTVTILLTGRAERLFDSLIRRMIRAKQLDFDLVCLKPEAGPSGQKLTTMDFKRTLLQDLVTTYREATEIRIYEDRPKQYVNAL